MHARPEADGGEDPEPDPPGGELDGGLDLGDEGAVRPVDGAGEEEEREGGGEREDDARAAAVDREGAGGGEGGKDLAEEAEGPQRLLEERDIGPGGGQVLLAEGGRRAARAGRQRCAREAAGIRRRAAAGASRVWGCSR